MFILFLLRVECSGDEPLQLLALEQQLELLCMFETAEREEEAEDKTGSAARFGETLLLK